MSNQLKAVTTMGAMAMALMASAPAFSQTVAEQVWHGRTLRVMDANKDGVISRQEYLDYMAAQFDKMDVQKKGVLDKAAFVNKKTMATTFVIQDTSD